MTSDLLIDGIDVFDKFGVSLLKGSYASLVTYPALKDPDKNDWYEFDGIEVDLSTPALDSRKITIQFLINDESMMTYFISMLSTGVYHTFSVQKLALTLTLRLISQRSYNTVGEYGFFSLYFSDDFPSNGYAYSTPTVSWASDGFYLDGKDFSHYGIRVLNGTMDEINKLPDAKANKSINLKKSNGVIYDKEYVKYGSKDVKLSLLLQTQDIPTFWDLYNSFIYDLTRPNTRTLQIDSLNKSYSCFYKSSSVTDIVVDTGVWLLFDITMTF
jgi:hypothetical protein